MNIKQHLPNPRHVLKAAKQLIPAMIAGIGVIVVVGLIVCGIFGFSRVFHDFYPLDASPVGPNLVASIFIVVGVAGLNEYKVVAKDEKEGKNLKAILHDAEVEVVAPVETFEQGVATDVETDLKDQGEVVLKDERTS